MASKERPIERKRIMPKQNDKKKVGQKESNLSVQELIKALNEDLAREYQAIIAYIVYSNVLSGAKWMQIAAELKLHAAEELQHALIIADQIDYLGGMPTASPKEVKLSDKPEEMLRFDLDNETETIRNYRMRVKQAEVLGHYALAEQLRKIISQEQEHQHDLATALGIDVPNVLPQGA
jgi:bacterioferritin